MAEFMLLAESSFQLLPNRPFNSVLLAFLHLYFLPILIILYVVFVLCVVFYVPKIE